MLEPAVGGELSLALVNGVLLALWAALPGLLLGYARQSLAARRIWPDFSLRQSEAGELERAVTLYGTVSGRIEDIDAAQQRSAGFWRALVGGTAEIPERRAEEHEDLAAHAEHLRAAIVRLRRRPLRRLRKWVHVLSAQSALGRAVAAYVLGFALMMVAFHAYGEQAWPAAPLTGATTHPVWYPFNAQLFYANAVGAAFAVLAAPVFYAERWVRLRLEYAPDFRAFKELAAGDPGRPFAQSSDADEPSGQPDATEIDGDDTWLEVLGLSNAATIEDVKRSYKTLIKQNHPDRVHGMSSAFQELAEVETRKLNAAYQQALTSMAAFESSPTTAPV